MTPDRSAPEGLVEALARETCPRYPSNNPCRDCLAQAEALAPTVARLIEDARREDREIEADIREQVLTEYANLPVAASERAVLNLTAERDALRERMAGVEALAAWWEKATDPGGYDIACRDHAKQLRAALHPTEADR